MYIAPEIIEDILHHADIVKVISSYLQVFPKGKDFVAKCPFHDDNNPSLSISQEKQIFNCFVCHSAGNAIIFVQKYENISYQEATLKVADICNYHPDNLENFKIDSRPKDKKREAMLACLKDLTAFYRFALKLDEGKAGYDYFLSRHLDEDDQKKYSLGFAPFDGKATVRFLQKKGHSLETIKDIGILSIKNDRDINEGRAIFPICNSEGEVVAFSARQLNNDKTTSKYINSPETYVFNKGKTLYNYHLAKEEAKLKKYVYLCEGFMDVFALSKIGINNAVALMGTSLTISHLDMLRRLGGEVRLCLDGDNPGQIATLKAITLLDQAGINFSIVDTSNNLKDPDEILYNDGPEALKNYLSHLTNKIDFTLNFYLKGQSHLTNSQKKELIDDMAPFINKINNFLEADSYIRRLAKLTGYEVETLRDYIKKKGNAAPQKDEINIKNDDNIQIINTNLRRLLLAESHLLFEMLNNKEAVDFYLKNSLSFYNEVYRSIAAFIVDYASKNNQIVVADLMNSIMMSELDNKRKEDLVNYISSLSTSKKFPKICDGVILNDLLNTINSEKERIYENDVYYSSIIGKSPIEQARILNDKLKKESVNKMKKEAK